MPDVRGIISRAQHRCLLACIIWGFCKPPGHPVQPCWWSRLSIIWKHRSCILSSTATPWLWLGTCLVTHQPTTAVAGPAATAPRRQQQHHQPAAAASNIQRPSLRRQHAVRGPVYGPIWTWDCAICSCRACQLHGPIIQCDLRSSGRKLRAARAGQKHTPAAAAAAAAPTAAAAARTPAGYRAPAAATHAASSSCPTAAACAAADAAAGTSGRSTAAAAAAAQAYTGPYDPR